MKISIKVVKLIGFSIPLLLASSCGNDDQIRQLEAQRDSLEQANAAVTERFSEVSDYLNLISTAVDSVATQEGLLLLNNDPETGRQFSRNEIRERVAKLGELIDRQRAKIAELNDSLKSRANNVGEIARLTTLVSYLNEQLAQKEAQMQQLQTELASSKRSIQQLTSAVAATNAKNEKLAADVSSLDNMVVERTNELNKGYLLAKNKKDLEQLGILSGGGLLKKAKFDPGSVNVSNCTPVDIRSFNEVTLTSKKKPNILSQIPSSSYTLEEIDKGKWRLTITDTMAFWSLSKIIVIELR